MGERRGGEKEIAVREEKEISRGGYTKIDRQRSFQFLDEPFVIPEWETKMIIK